MIAPMKNKYVIRSKISQGKFRQILKLFCLDIEASKIAEICGVSRQCVNRIFHSLRNLIAKECEKNSKILSVKSKSMKATLARGVCVGKKGVVLTKNHRLWHFKTRWTRAYANRQKLLCKGTFAHYSKRRESQSKHDL